MKEVRYFYVPQASASFQLPEEEAKHAIRVLRLKEGDEMFLMDGKGCFYKAVVNLVSSKHCQYEIIETMPQEKSWNGTIHIAMAPTKMMDRVEWFVEKATEIGTDVFSFLNCKFSERKVLRTDRVEKIVIGAVKQSRKPWMPVVNEMEDFRSFIKANSDGERFIAHCYDEIERDDLFDILNNEENKDADITVLVGPEGDFSIEEVRFALENGYRSISLGNSRLRTETAALMAVSMCQLARRK